MNERSASVHPGDVLAGKYRVERVLGQGGMGVVVAAHHLQLDEKVALKFLLPDALGDAEAAGRFLREARAAVKIKSEHVARVSDVGTLPNGAPYMVMEYLEGGDLAAWLRDRGPLPVEQAVEFVLQACVAVADAHALGIVHRDLKPANLFCVRRSDGQLSIKVLDFGISKLTDVSGTGPAMAMTKTASLMGSPLYMSPEQMRSSKDVDAGTDIWAIGVIVFELITGRAPFLGASVTELAINVAGEPPPSMRTFRPDTPPALEAVVFRCLEKERARRYRNIGELALALLPFGPKRAKASVERISGILQAAGLSESALAVPASPPVDSTAPTGTLPPYGRTTVGGPRGKSTALAIGAFGLIAVASAGTFFALSRKKPPPPPTETVAVANAPAVAAAASPVVSDQGALPIEPVQPVEVKVADLAAAQPSASAHPAVSTQPPAISVPAAVTVPKPAAKPNANSKAPPAVGASAPPAKAAVNCDPPFFFNANGARVFKKECL